jgi:hypothetical protein
LEILELSPIGENSVMRKRITGSASQGLASAKEGWLDLEQLAEVEVTSEHPDFPIESALIPGTGRGWRAKERGEQTILLSFNKPQRIRRIWLRFVEPDVERTHEFTLSWSAGRARSFKEIVRQQWNFSPNGSTSESEDYRVDLNGVAALKLTIKPDLQPSKAIATLSELRLA